MVQRIHPLDDAQLTAWEAQIEQVVVDGLQSVMDIVAARVARVDVQVSAALVAADENPPPMTAELAIPAPEPVPAVIPDVPGPPGQPYVSLDDLATIPPMWQQVAADQVLPLVAQIFVDAAGNIRAQMLEAVPAVGVLTVPALGSAAAEEYMRGVANTYEQVGQHLWATARDQLSQGFEAGESIPELSARLRRSAGLAARTSVLVARTSVIEASNAGSIAMARVSGLQMLKEWIATPDLRTRPEHLAADGQRVPLGDPFIVGGYAGDFPADPALPPSMRYRCRCAVGYVMPEQPKEIPSPTIDQVLPGSPAVAEIEAPVLGEVAAKEPGPVVPAAVLADNPRQIRPSLMAARTPRQLRETWQAEMRAATGRDIEVESLPLEASPSTVREYAEATIQMLERFPEARLRRIAWMDSPGGAYAQVSRGSQTITINEYWASEENRRRYLARLRSDVAGWDGSPTETSWSVRGASFPQATIYHEFGHIVDMETLGSSIKLKVLKAVERRAAAEQLAPDKMIARDVSTYASSSGPADMEELIGEAFTDVVLNGNAASALSREIYDLLVTEYRRRGFDLRTMAAETDLPPFGLEDFPRLPGIGTSQYQAALAELQRDMRLPELPMQSRRQSGENAVTTEIAHEGGASTIRKEFTRLGESKAASVRRADAEELGGLVADAVGLRAPATFRVSPQVVEQQFVRGRSGEEILSFGQSPGPDLTDSDDGRLMGLLDVLIGNRDRNAGNWLRDADGRLIAIDHEDAFQAARLEGARDSFGARLLGGDPGAPPTKWPKVIDIHPADLAIIRERLEMLAPEFDRLKRGTWFKQVMVRLDEIEKRASATAVRRIEAEVTPDMRASLTVGERGALDELMPDELDQYWRDRAAGMPHRLAISSPTERAALVKQERLDQVKALSNVTGDLFRLIEDQVSVEGLRETIGALARTHKLPDVDRDALLAALGRGVPALKRKVLALERREGLTRVGEPGERVAFDRRIYDDASAGLAPGTPVVVARPGFTFRYPGDATDTRIARPVVFQDAAAPKAAARSFDDRVREAVHGDAALRLPPVKVTVDASSGSDTGKWKAIEAAGVTGSPSSLLSAVTSRVRVSGMANQRLRLPEGRPMAQWEIDLRATYTPEMRSKLEAADVARRAKEAAAGDREIRALDKAMRQSELSEDVVLWRGAQSSDFGLPAGDSVGFEWVDPGYVGTSTERAISESFLARDPVMMRILAPRGTSGIRISGGGENEILLDRGLRFRVVAEREATSFGRKYRQIDVEVVPVGAAPTVDVAVARQAAIDTRRAVAGPLGEVSQLLGDEVPARVLAARADALAASLTGDAKKALTPLIRALKTGDDAKIRRAVTAAEKKAGLRRSGTAGDVVDFDRKAHVDIGGESIPVGAKVRIVRPAYDTTIDGEDLQLAKAQVEALTEAEVRDIERRAVRAAARERNKLIESRAGTARLLAEIDELLAKKADLAVIRQRLDPALIAPEMPFANADPAILEALRKAADAGEAKLRTAVTSSTRKAGLKATGKAGAKVKFDPDTMESLPGVDIPAGAQVQVVTRGTTLEIPGPDGPTVIRLTKAQVATVQRPVRSRS